VFRDDRRDEPRSRSVDLQELPLILAPEPCLVVLVIENRESLGSQGFCEVPGISSLLPSEGDSDVELI
jgi:hypothetical protein